MNRKKDRFMCTGNQEQRFSQINCQEGRGAEGLRCRGDRKQDNGRLVLEIIPEPGVFNACRISVTHRARLKRRKWGKGGRAHPCLEILVLGLKVSHSYLSVLAPSPAPTLNDHSGLRAGMESSLNLWPPRRLQKLGEMLLYVNLSPCY